MASSQWCFADFRLDPDNACLWCGTQSVALKPKAFDVLHYLVTHPDRLVTKDTLLDAVWPETAISDAVVRIAIGELRRALGDTAQAPRFIATVHRRGYRFLAPVVEHLEEVPEPVSPVLPTMPPPAVPHSALVVPPPAALLAPEAERRQLTVLFCDLVDSTILAGQLDPEDYREVVRAYHQTCAAVIQQYDGYIAQYLGDGVLVYFGYPRAHEDDAQRAVRTGLGILHALDSLNTRLPLPPGERLAVRLGIHTGLVVVGNMGVGARQEPLAMGETPNLAARLQAFAAPNTLVISAATWQLLGGFFACQALGPKRLHGRAQPLEVYQVLSETMARSRLEAASRTGLTPLVGREQEAGLLRERWVQVKDGLGQVVLLRGEGGIGKSRLVQTLKNHVATETYTRLECHSSPYFTNSTLYPIIEMMRRKLRFRVDDTPEQKLAKLEQNLSPYRLPLEESVPLFAALLSLPIPEDKYPPPDLSPQRQRQKTLASMVAIILELAEQQPVLFILEDLHWTDASTLELLDLLIDQTPAASIYVLLTCRLEFQPSWRYRSYLTEVTVNRLSRHQIEQMAMQVTGGKTLPAEVLGQLVARTDGVPLYVEEMTKAVLESGWLKEADGQYALTGPFSSLSIPTTLQDSLMARLDHLASAKAVAQYASVIGRQFSYDLLQSVSQLDEAMLQHELNRLVEAELVYQRGWPPQATYMFKHALVQDAAYQSLLRRTRQAYHRRIAEVLAERFPERAETQPELLAHHYMEAGLNEEAIHYWHRAGRQAVARSANQEAINHLTKGLELLKTRPDTPQRTQQELDVLITLGPALIATQGYVSVEVEQVYNRAYELCHYIGKEEQRFSVLMGLRRFYANRGELGTAREIGEELLTLAQRQQDPTFLLEAYWSLSGVLFYRGELALVRQHLDQAVAIYASQGDRSQSIRHGTIPGIHCLSWLSLTLWMCGYTDQALQWSHQALSLARQQPSLFTLHFVLMQTALLHHYRREWSLTQDYVESADALQPTQGRDLHVAGAWSILQPWALVMQGKAHEGIALMCQKLNEERRAGIPTYAHAILAEAYGKINQIEKGLNALAEGCTMVDGPYLHGAEVHRLKGELLLQQSPDNNPEAELCFHQAISIAQRQQAKSWELRAATSLARLWQRQGKRKEAYELLAPVYNWFTEGFDTADLQEAEALLDELARARSLKVPDHLN
jgi:class 3 adenylate cyclase/DNA-binding winged helix-turn-helix (wHTH) protein/predicted ATPase